MEDFFNSLGKTVLEYWILICIVIATTGMAIMRTAKEKGKADYLEAGMCALFATSIWFVLDWLGLPAGAGVGIGTFIGYIGTHKFIRWVSKKVGLESTDIQ